MKNYLTLLFMLTALTFSACKKGENGADGATGAKGEQGLKGVDGSTIHSGTGAPASTLGNVGDFYLDKNTAELYGPKTATGWPTPISLKGSTGATGAAGTAGSKILSGTTAPSLAIGIEGDFYFDTANLNFYGPKTASSWGNAINLGATNTVTTFLYNEQSFDNVVLKSSYYDSYNDITRYYFEGAKNLSISHQAFIDAYDRGIIILKIKLFNNSNSYWNDAFNVEKTSGNENENESIYGAIDWDNDNLTRSGIKINGEESTINDLNGDNLKNVKFDVKVVCIPAGTVLQMSAKNIDVKDTKAIAKYLRL